MGTFNFRYSESNDNPDSFEFTKPHCIGSTIRSLFFFIIVIKGEPVSLNLLLSKLSNRTDWKFKQQTGSNCIYTELRFTEPPKDPSLIARIPYSFIDIYLNILVDTTLSSEVLFSKISASKKRQVFSSIKAGSFVRPAVSEEEVKSFYRIISDLYRKKIKKPLIPEDVFLRFFRDKNTGKVLLVFYDNKVVGGMLCPFYAKEEMYEWYIAGLDTEMKKYKVYPSVLVTWEAIKFASDNGFRQFNFLGAGKSDQPYGVRDFKMRFCGKLVEAPRLIFIHKPFLYKLGKLAIRLGLGY